MNTIIHSTGWDGIFCCEIAMRALGEENCTSYGWEPGSPPLVFPKAGIIFVLGLPLDTPFDSLQPYDCENNWSRLTWIHNDPEAIRLTDEGVPGLRLSGVANCRLAYAYFHRSMLVNPLVLPTKADFALGRLQEPYCLMLVQEFAKWVSPSQLAMDFIRMLEMTDGIDWDRLLAPWSDGAYLLSLCRSGIETPGQQEEEEEKPDVMAELDVEAELDDEALGQWLREPTDCKTAETPAHPKMDCINDSVKVLFDGFHWRATWPGFAMLDKDPVGFGCTLKEACVDLGWKLRGSNVSACAPPKPPIPLAQQVITLEDARKLLAEPVMVGIRGSKMHQELCRYLDTHQVDSNNIHRIRGQLFVLWESEWNDLVRRETATRDRGSQYGV